MQAVTLPASWYTQATALQLEKQRVLYNTWQVGCSRSVNAHALLCAVRQAPNSTHPPHSCRPFLGGGLNSAVLCCAVQMVCPVSQVQAPGDYVCGTIADVRYLLVRGQDGQLRAFHNVRRMSKPVKSYYEGQELHAAREVAA
jgi:hypothetical protein